MTLVMLKQRAVFKASVVRAKHPFRVLFLSALPLLGGLSPPRQPWRWASRPMASTRFGPPSSEDSKGAPATAKITRNPHGTHIGPTGPEGRTRLLTSAGCQPGNMLAAESPPPWEPWGPWAKAVCKGRKKDRISRVRPKESRAKRQWWGRKLNEPTLCAFKSCWSGRRWGCWGWSWLAVSLPNLHHSEQQGGSGTLPR